MSLYSKVLSVIKRPAKLIIGMQLRYAYAFNNQKALVRALYWNSMHKHLNLKNPRSFTEKIQWLKLYDHNPLYHIMVDKYEVKQYVSQIIGKEYIIPTYGVWKSFDEINFDALPDKFVIKTTNGGGNTGVVICKNKLKLDKTEAKRKLHASAQKDIYKNTGEWSYKGIIPRIIVEQYMQNGDDSELTDYKFYCFYGRAEYCQLIANRRVKETIDFYDRKWEHMPFWGLNPDCTQSDKIMAKPENYDSMLRIAEKIAKGIPFVRVDLYNINGKIYFGEMTFYPASGFGSFTPDEWDLKFGDMLVLPNNSI